MVVGAVNAVGAGARQKEGVRFTIRPPAPVQVVILGGGFGGLYTALRLQKIFRRDENVHVTLVDRNNYFTLTPLLFEAGSGVLEPRHAVSPVRTLLKKVRFVEGEVERVDVAGRKVHARHGTDEGAVEYELPYDHLVVALGGVTNRKLIPGSEHGRAFKTLRDAIDLRNHVIDLFEQADAQADEARRRELLTFVIIGAGLVGVELMGELTEFVGNLGKSYPRLDGVRRRFVLVEAAGKILPEMEEDLAEFAGESLRKRGVEVRTGTKVERIEEGRVHLPGGEVIGAATVVLAAGVGANPIVEGMEVEKVKWRIATEGSMRSKSDRRVWALGDCAAIPDGKGKYYPQLAQHALREAKVLARNVARVIRAEMAGDRREPWLETFKYQTLGTLAALGHYNGVGKVMGVKIKGFLAWWVWRTYYLMKMPRWNRRIRIMLDWTTALLFKNDVVKLDFGEEKAGGGRQ